MRNLSLTKKIIGGSLLLILSLLGLQGFQQDKAHAAYDGNRIIDDALFLDARSMDKSAVQSFLNSKGGQIASKSFLLNCDAAGSQAEQSYLSLGAPCGQSAPAADIIYYAAQVYGISPKVILTTLQKEQSLVTAPNPTARQYAQAMGYACPTSGNCSDSSNFFWQIDNGTWVLRFHYERAHKNMNWWYSSSSWVCGTAKEYYKPNLYPQQNVNFYDENGTHYRTHYIHNAATSSMYCYTPHAYNNPEGLYGRAPYGTTGLYYSGSYNFVYFYELWFGSTRGLLVRSVESSALYYYDGRRKFSVPSMQLMAEYGLTSADVRFISQSEINSIPSGQDSYSTSIGQIIKTPDDSDTDGGSLYFVSNGYRFPIASMTQFNNFGFSTANIKYVSFTVIDNLRLGQTLSDFVQAPDLSVYRIENGKSRAIFELSKLASLNPSGKVSSFSNATLAMWSYGQPIVDGDYVIVNPSGAMRLYNGSSFYTIPSLGVAECWDLASVKTFRVWSFAVTNGTSKGTLNCFARDSSNNPFIMSESKRFTLPSDHNLPLSYPSDWLVNRLTAESLKPVIKGSGSGLAAFEGGKRRPIPTMAVFNELGYDTSSISTIHNSAFNGMPLGAYKLAIGTLTLEPNGAVSIVASASTRLQITSVDQFNHFGYSWKSLLSVGAAELAAYSSTGNLPYYFKVGTQAMLMDKGVRYIIPSDIYPHYGRDINTTPSLDIKLVDHALTWSLSRFIKSTSSPAVYYVENGQKRPITSWQRVVELGGENKIVTLSIFRVGSLPTGSSI